MFDKFMQGLLAVGATGMALVMLGFGIIILGAALRLVFGVEFYDPQ